MNEIEYLADHIRRRDRQPVTAASAESVRPRTAALANDPGGAAFPDQPGSPLDSVTAQRLRRIREADHRRYESLRARAYPPTDDAGRSVDGADQPVTGAGASTGIPPAGTHPKPIFDRTGYEVPKSVTSQYVAHDGKFLDRRSETVHFEDMGRKLATDSEDREVIAHMVEVAKAKHWGELQLKGTEEFRRQAWIAAELAGVHSRGFKPDEQDQALLTAARESIRISAGQRQPEEPPRNTIESAPDQNRNVARASAPARESPTRSTEAPPAAGSARPRKPRRSPAKSADGKESTPSAARNRSSANVTSGVLVNHGAAPFNHDRKQNLNYYATVRTADGEQTVWGLDLERAIVDSGVQVGQRIELQKAGSKTVATRQRQFDPAGNELEPRTVTSRRNEWRVSSPDVAGMPSLAEQRELESVRLEVEERRQVEAARERFLNGEWQYTKDQQATLEAARERIKEQAAREVLRDEIRNLPEEQQEQLMGEFEGAVAAARAANRPLDVPMPRVSEAAIEAVRAQIEQGRSAQDRGGRDASPETSPVGAHHQEAAHDTPSFELEP